jgi:cytochrome-b5 reductase
MATEYTLAEVSLHKTEDDYWTVVKGKVYKIPKSFITNDHPGGDVIMEGAGIDSTTLFEDIGHSQEALDQLKTFYIGDLKK